MPWQSTPTEPSQYQLNRSRHQTDHRGKHMNLNWNICHIFFMIQTLIFLNVVEERVITKDEPVRCIYKDMYSVINWACQFCSFCCGVRIFSKVLRIQYSHRETYHIATAKNSMIKGHVQIQNVDPVGGLTSGALSTTTVFAGLSIAFSFSSVVALGASMMLSVVVYSETFEQERFQTATIWFDVNPWTVKYLRI